MKKILFLSLLIALSVSVLFGCGGDKPVVTEPPATDAPVVTDPIVTDAPVVTEAPGKEVKPVEEYADFVNRVEIVGTTDKDALSYKLGEEITFNISLKYDSKEIVGCRQFDYTIMADGAEPYGERISGKDGQFSVTVPAGYIKEPGSVRIRVTAKSQKGIMLGSFIGGAIVNMDEISSSDPIPTDFADFWRGNLQKLFAVNPTDKATPGGDKHYSNYFHYYKMDEAYMRNSLNCESMVSKLSTHDFYEVFLSAPGEMPAVFYISIPKNLKSDSCSIYMHLNHYSPRNAYIGAKDDQIFVGVGPCGMPGVYYDEKTGSYTKVPYDSVGTYFVDGPGYENAENVYFVGMLQKNIQVLRFLSNPEYTKGTPFEAVTALYNGKVSFEGGSMGGFQSIATAALVTLSADIGKNVGSVASIKVSCPWMCDPLTIAGATDRIKGEGARPNTTSEVLNYFDTAHFATLIKCEDVVVSGGFADVICPSTGLAALYNALNCKTTFKMMQNMDHNGNVPKTVVEYSLTK